MICEKCGTPLDTLVVDIFDHQGSDAFLKHHYTECDENAVVIDVSPAWAGNDLTEEEQRETIRCPRCNQFPFENGEIQTFEFVRIVCFKSNTNMKGAHS